MSLPKDKAWFPAKKYGFGWGVPRRWQGWVVMLGYVGSVGGIAMSAVRTHYWLLVSSLTGLSALLIALCVWKGESPTWRWGGADDDRRT